VTDDNPIPPQAVDVPFLVTASELRDEKIKGDGSKTIYPAAPKPSAGL